METIIPLESHYVLRVTPERDGLAGEVIMLNGDGSAQGTRLFTAPLQTSAEALEAWSRRALQAYREG
ncbi:hypothetical protein LJK88_33600 [Paenibacillus sp. P26]|nr:hypothetical protein LJK88_33600 [Paenibacillus sp. P26]